LPFSATVFAVFGDYTATIASATIVAVLVASVDEALYSCENIFDDACS